MTGKPDEIIDHYNRYDESERLTHDIGPLELARTQELIQRFLPPPGAVILDVGGANGIYSFWMARMGYRVHLVDIVPRHIAQARAVLAQPGSPQMESLSTGDARALDFPDACAEGVLMHGPLYHLTEHTERLQALSEARRVLKPGGVLLAFAITRYAGLIYGLSRGFVFDDHFLSMIQNEVRSGRRENPPEWLFTFPSAYFHLPEDLGEEVSQAGFALSGVLGVIGPAWQVPDLDRAWQNSDHREALLAVARLTENEPVLGPRLLAVGRKPL
jgi:ubiquinone/menaquinone biosynthesis C-methylase UbiE